MEVKPKKCKGINKAKDFKGCGELSTWRKYGLCTDCFKEWLYTTAEGKEMRLKSIDMAKKKVREKFAKEQRAKDRKAKLELKPKSYWEARLENIINRIVRKIDYGQACISSGRPLGKLYHAGHFHSVGANASLRFNLLNIWGQTLEQNNYKGGNPIGYAENLQSLFGEGFFAEILSLKRRYPVIKLSIPELRVCIQKAKEAEKIYEGVFDNIREGHLTKSQDFRIELRRLINDYIGIY